MQSFQLTTSYSVLPLTIAIIGHWLQSILFKVLMQLNENKNAFIQPWILKTKVCLKLKLENEKLSLYCYLQPIWSCKMLVGQPAPDWNASVWSDHIRWKLFASLAPGRWWQSNIMQYMMLLLGQCQCHISFLILNGEN